MNMRTKNCLLLLLLFLFPVVLFSGAEKELEPILLKRSVVQIVVAFPKQIVGIGTAFVVSDGKTLASAAHVYLDAEKLMVEQKSGYLAARFTAKGKTTTSTVSVLDFDTRHDLAILKLSVANPDL